MKLTRRGLFGLFGGAVATAPAVSKLLDAAAKAPPIEEVYQHKEVSAGFTVLKKTSQDTWEIVSPREYRARAIEAKREQIEKPIFGDRYG